MSACPELSLMYRHYNTEQQALDTFSQHHLHRSIPPIQSPPLQSSFQYQNNNNEELNGSRRSEYVTHHMNAYDQQKHSAKNNARILSPPLSTVSSSSSVKTPLSSPSNGSAATASRNVLQPTWNITWLVFMNEKWVPFDVTNQVKLEQTLTVGGTFVDISDSHFPGVKRVRVFPKNYYLSYLGVKYRLSRVMQPDAYLDHVSVAQKMSKDDNRLKKRVWEM